MSNAPHHLPIVANTMHRHPSTTQIVRYFDFTDLPEHLRPVSKQFHDLALSVVLTTPDGPELTAGLRKLLEAKDCIVRAAVDAHNYNEEN